MAEKTAGIRTAVLGKKKPAKAITFKAGGLHDATDTKPGVKIPASKHAAAKAGSLGPTAKKQETFFENVLRRGKAAR